LNAPGRPVGNLLFLGPTGSGQDESGWRPVAESLFGDARACIQESIARSSSIRMRLRNLIGSPPGYLGHRETHPLLTQEALKPVAHGEAQVVILLV